MDRDVERKPAGRHRRRGESDPVVVALRVCSLVAAAFALFVGTLVVSGDGPQVAQPPIVEPPASTTVTTSTEPTATTTRATTTLATTTKRAVTTIAPAEPPVAAPPATTSVTRERPRVAVVGEPCPSRGEVTITADYRPVVCSPDGRDDALVWRSIL